MNLTNLMASIRALFSLKTVDVILADLDTAIQRLEAASKAHEAKADKHEAKIQKLANKAADALDESDRAARVAEKLKALVS